VHVTDLRCEHLVNPVTDNARPALSWVVRSESRGAVQTAYRILVASSREGLDRDEGDLWDTGKVSSAETLNIPYDGKPLVSRQVCWWKVRAWDAADAPSPWSEPARWEMALLEPGDWRAKWIRAAEPPSAAETEPVDTFEGLQWVWHPGEAAREGAPAGTRVFRKMFRVPEGKTVRNAFFRLAVDNRFDLYVNGHLAGRGDNFKNPVTADVGAYLTNGENTLAIVAENAQGPAGVIGFLRVQLDPGDRLTIPVDATWKAGKGTDPGADDAGWPDAEVIGAYGDDPWGRVGTGASLVLPPAPLFRREFEIARPVRSARLYITALGAYDATVNGKPVTGDMLRPGWTDFRKRVQYQTYDVTDLVRQGANCLGATVGSGWAVGYVGFGGRDRYGIGRQRFLAQLEVAFEDGASEVITTDTSWRASYGGTLEADTQMGETYDARKEPDGWNLPGFDDASWPPVEEAAWDAPLEAYPGVPVRRLKELKPLARTEPKSGTFIFDLGQNMVGWARLKVSGPAGTSVRLRFAEMLNPDGTAYTTNLRAARATDTYTLKGEGIEVWEPRFTFHGFRYVEVTGYPGTPPMDAVTGIVAGSDTPYVGDFACSNPLLNQLQHNIQWGQRGNFLEVPTDCPQRDERLGWMGDAQVFARAACVNADTAAFFIKWLRDVRDAQTKDGAFTDVSPDLLGGHGVAGWAEAGIIVPVTLYRFTGDRRFLEDNYEAMSRYIAWMEANSNDLIRPAEGYGDWLSIGAETPKDVIGTAFFAWMADEMAHVAEVLGKPGDARRFEDLAARVREAFNKAFVSPDGRIAGDTQTDYVLALHMNLLPDGLRSKAVQYLVDDIVKRGDHLSTGFLGTAYVMQVLTRFGRTDVAYRLLLQDTMPSWLFCVKNGATTIWERWDGWTPDKGFQDPGMNSFNHYAFGAVGAWMTGVITGLEPLEPGFRRISIRPQPGGGLTHAEAAYGSTRGPVRSAWRIEKGRMTLEVTVPANTTALVSLPTAKASEVTEGGVPASAAEGVVFEGIRDGRAEYRVGGGRYRFVFPYAGA
jgi:alpha-L-rhamnosidase